MNRARSHGQAVIHHKTHALYGLINRLRTAFKDLEIETCASDGARPDDGILKHIDRIWTSDVNDAHDRCPISHAFHLSVTITPIQRAILK